MAIEKAEIKIQCPFDECKKSGVIEIPKYLLDSKKFGTLKIKVNRGICCDHEFITFIDRNGIVRGYEKVERSINLADFMFKERKESNAVYLGDLIKRYQDYALLYMFHALLLNVKICLLLKDGESIKFPMKVNSLFMSFLPEKYKEDLLVFSMPELEYQNKGLDKKNMLVIDPFGNIAENPWKDIPYTREREIINKALFILDNAAQSVIVRHEFKKIFDIVEWIVDYLKDVESIYEDNLKQVLIKNNIVQSDITDDDISLFTQICFFRFGIPREKINNRSLKALKTGLWGF